MLAAARAELLVLRKWPAAWGLLLIAPALTLVTSYVVTFVEYLTVSPAQYSQLGSPSQMLPALLPSQFVIDMGAQGHSVSMRVTVSASRRPRLVSTMRPPA